eukprot:2004738-Pyramimonas_sp.AAC.1
MSNLAEGLLEIVNCWNPEVRMLELGEVRIQVVLDRRGVHMLVREDGLPEILKAFKDSLRCARDARGGNGGAFFWDPKSCKYETASERVPRLGPPGELHGGAPAPSLVHLLGGMALLALGGEGNAATVVGGGRVVHQLDEGVSVREFGAAL